MSIDFLLACLHFVTLHKFKAKMKKSPDKSQSFFWLYDSWGRGWGIGKLPPHLAAQGKE